VAKEEKLINSVLEGLRDRKYTATGAQLNPYIAIGYRLDYKYIDSRAYRVVKRVFSSRDVWHRRHARASYSCQGNVRVFGTKGNAASRLRIFERTLHAAVSLSKKRR